MEICVKVREFIVKREAKIGTNKILSIYAMEGIQQIKTPNSDIGNIDFVAIRDLLRGIPIETIFANWFHLNSLKLCLKQKLLWFQIQVNTFKVELD